MRIIAGDKGGALVETLPGQDTRPTLERVKEGMFSAIHFILPGAQVLDLFAGSGQLGLEALSRGAAFCTFIDENRQAVELIKKNLQKTGMAERALVLQTNVEAFLAGAAQKYDVVLADPPYKKGYFPRLLEPIEKVVLPGGIVICETERSNEIVFEGIDGLTLKKQYHYGTVMVSRFQKIDGIE